VQQVQQVRHDEQAPPRQSRQDVEAVLRPSRWANGMQVIGAIPGYVARQLDLATAARSVWLHEQAVAHICTRCAASPADAEFVFDYMPAAVLRPMFCGVERKGETTRISLVEFIKAERRYLFLSVRLATTRGGDELWVSSGYPVNDETLRRYLRTGRLQPVVGERRLEGGKTRTARLTPRGAATQMP
jgi:hypothetical protein